MGAWGKAGMANEVRPCGVPRRSFGFFPIAGKETRPAGRNPATNKTALSSPPHPPQCAHWGTFPPKGKAYGRPKTARTEKNGGEAPTALVPQKFHKADLRGPSVSGEAKRSFAENSFAYFSFQEK